MKKKILISSGGSGGHVIPATIFYEHLKNKFEVFFTVDKRGAKFLNLEKYKVTIIDTPGAYPGIGAEERGQSAAIASNLLTLAALKTPIINLVIGEGGSGGALAIGMGDSLIMLEYSIYSVISPEACSSILWPPTFL